MKAARALFLSFVAVFAAAAASAGGQESDDAAMYRDARDRDLSAPEDGGGSVNISQEFGLSSGRQSIDSFLGDFENPYAADESTYKGTASEARKERMDALEKQ